ncbi:hypothetical protein [Blastococcus saxobsidens]|uniref:Uncharacterized protein n=1 Tax=Blastococcus saxobsidens TaxID=138336 RepID=A0A4Q7YBE6_9ACTN|nr:hypothetical protein [Blastococcus saxobsidens]RZU33455.1 hypothetical protein BKA19_3184 [Blastococcus saxobsidens]
MTSTTGIHGQTTIATWPQTQWPRMQRALAGQVALVRSAMAAAHAYEYARTDAARRQVMADFIGSVR